MSKTIDKRIIEEKVAQVVEESSRDDLKELVEENLQEVVAQISTTANFILQQEGEVSLDELVSKKVEDYVHNKKVNIIYARYCEFISEDGRKPFPIARFVSRIGNKVGGSCSASPLRKFKKIVKDGLMVGTRVYHHEDKGVITRIGASCTLSIKFDDKDCGTVSGCNPLWTKVLDD